MEEKMGRREQKKILSRKAILDAAVQEFSRNGFKDTSVAEIMKTADLGIGTFYNYFQSKEEILVHLLERMVQELDEALAELRAAKCSADTQLAAAGRITAKFLDENRYVLPLFLAASDHAGQPDGQKGAPRVHTSGFKPIFIRILQDGQLAGEIRTDVAPELIAEMFHSIYQAAAFSKIDVSFQENVALKTKILLDGIKVSNKRR